MPKPKKSREITHEEPFAECQCCGHLIYHKSKAHPEGLKTIPKNCPNPQCGCPDVQLFKKSEEGPGDEPKEEDEITKINLDDDEYWADDDFISSNMDELL